MSELSWDQLFERFLSSRRLTASTIRGYRKNLRTFLEFTPAPSPLETTSAHLGAFYLAQKSRPQVSLATAGSRLRTVLILLRWAVQQELMAFDPGHDIQIAEPRRPIPRILTRQEVDALIAVDSDENSFWALRDAAILETLYGSGLRAGEAVSLDLEDVDLAEDFFSVHPSKSKARRTPFGVSVARALAAYLKVRDQQAQVLEKAFFVSRHGYRMDAGAVASLVRRRARILGIADATPHALRRAFATHMLENGANIVELKNLLGHEDINSTLYYAQVVPTEMLRSYHKSHPRARRARGDDHGF